MLLTVAFVVAGASSDCWPLVEKAAALAEGVPSSPLSERVRLGKRETDVGFDYEVGESLDAARASQPALRQLDAALAIPKCSLPKDPNAGRVLALVEKALAVALVDGATNSNPAWTVHGLMRAADLAARIVDGGGATRASASLALDVAQRARTAAFVLAQRRLIDEAALARVAAALDAASSPRALERVVTGKLDAQAQAAVLELGKKLDDGMRDQARLHEIAKDVSRAAKANEELRCNATPDPLRYTVARGVGEVMLRRGHELMMGDSLVIPSSEGAQVMNAGPIARSCGIEAGDVVVDINGVGTVPIERALTEAPRKVSADGRAQVRVRRGGRELLLLVEPK